MKTHITTLNNIAGTASLAHRRVLKVAQSIGCHEMGLSFYPLKPDYAKEIDKRLDGIIAPLNYGDIVIFQYPSWIGVNYDESFVNKIKSYRDTKLIIFVQDIQKLMFDSEQAILDMEIKTLNKADLLILPSKKMHRYLKENGLDEKPVIYQTTPLAAATPPAAPAPAAPAAPAVPNTPIQDAQVPLGVNEDEDNLQNIEDEDTPLAAGGTAKDGIKTWWWWIAAAVAAITGKGVYDNRRRKPAKSDDSEDNSDEK